MTLASPDKAPPSPPADRHPAARALAYAVGAQLRLLLDAMLQPPRERGLRAQFYDARLYRRILLPAFGAQAPEFGAPS